MHISQRNSLSNGWSMLKYYMVGLLILCGGANALIQQDNYTNSTQSSGTSLTWSHTINNGTDTTMVVCIGATSTLSTLNVTYGSTNLINLRNNSDGVGKAQLWYTNNLSAGTANIQINTSSSVAVKASAITFSGVNSTNPIDNHTGNQTSGAASTTHVTYLTTTTSNTAIVDCLSTGFVTTHTAAAVTNRTTIFSNSTTPDPGTSSSVVNLKASSGIVALSWTTSAGRRGGINSLSLNPALYTTNSCTYSGSGDWIIAASDNCVLSSNTLVGGELLCEGTGTLTINATISANKMAFANACYTSLSNIGVCAVS